MNFKILIPIPYPEDHFAGWIKYSIALSTRQNNLEVMYFPRYLSYVHFPLTLSNFDAVYFTSFYKRSLLLAMVCVLTKKPFFVRLAGNELKGSPIRKAITTALMRKARNVVVLNSLTKLQLESYRINSVLLGNGVQITPASEKRKLSKDSVKFGMLGVVCPRKNQLGLINVFSDTFPSNFSLHIGGDLSGSFEGADRYSKACLSKASHQIKFHGNVNSSTFLKSIDVFVLNSLSEGMPNALLEAMAEGCLCFATNIAGNSDIFGDLTQF